MRTENDQAAAVESVRAVVDCLRARQAEIARAIYDRLREAVPDSEGSRDPTYQAGVLAALNAVLSYSLDAIEHRPGWFEPIPPEAAAQARRAARLGVSLGAVVRRYIAGHGRLSEFVAEEAAPFGFASYEPVLPLIGSTLDALLGHFTAAIETEYAQEQQRIASSPEQHRAATVHKLLTGGPSGAGELVDLRYELDAWHLGVIATGTAAAKAVGSLAARLSRKLLLIAHDEQIVWAWLGGDCRLAFTDIQRTLLPPEHVDVALAVGESRSGIAGWRQTHREAQGAALVARYRPCKLTRYLDVALDATALQDEALADSLIETYLSPLDEMRMGGQAARGLLRALFGAEYNVSSAAHALKAHRSTVHRQRSEIERRLGCQLHERQAEIEVALRIEELRRASA